MTKGQFKKILEIRKRTGIKYIPGKDNPQGFIGRYNNNPVKNNLFPKPFPASYKFDIIFILPPINNH